MNFHFARGLTLIEVLIAAGVLALFMGNAVTLGRSITRNQIIVQDQNQARALAAEAIEIIRNKRDSVYINQKQDRFNEYISSCANQDCQNREISWNPDSNDWTIDDNLTQLPTPVDGGQLTSIETDNDPIFEIITVNINTGEISDNVTRVNTNKYLKKSCDDRIAGAIVYCRTINIAPVVYDGDVLNQYNGGALADKINLPPVTLEDPEMLPSQPIEFAFDAFLNASFRITAKVKWNSLGKTRSIETTDVITNRR